MSEFSPQGYGTPGPEPVEAVAANKRDPRLVIGGGIGLAVLALGGGFLLLGGGGGSNSGATTAARPAVTRTATPTSTVIPVGSPTAVVHAFKGDVGRDPFQALVTPPPPKVTVAATGATTGGATATTGPAATTSPGAVVGPTGLPPTGLPVTGPTLPVTPTIPVNPTPTATQAPKVLVVLKAIAFHDSTPYVVVTYAGKQYGLKTGETASGSLKVLAIAPDDGTATFQLGDQTFDLHIGQSYVD